MSLLIGTIDHPSGKIYCYAADPFAIDTPVDGTDPWAHIAPTNSVSHALSKQQSQ